MKNIAKKILLPILALTATGSLSAIRNACACAPVPENFPNAQPLLPMATPRWDSVFTADPAVIGPMLIRERAPRLKRTTAPAPTARPTASEESTDYSDNTENISDYPK